MIEFMWCYNEEKQHVRLFVNEGSMRAWIKTLDICFGVDGFTYCYSNIGEVRARVK